MLYEIDDKDRIVRVSADWTEFASNNDAPHLGANTVIGRPLMTFIKGDATQMLYHTLMARARRSMTALEHEFRCDSPQTQRYLSMKLTPFEGYHIRFSTLILRSVPRARAVGARFAQGSRSKRCSICGKISFRGGPFLEPEHVASTHETLNVYYGVCAPCQARVFAMAQ